MISYQQTHGDALGGLKARTEAPIEAIPTPWETWNRACRGRGGRKGLALGWHVAIAGKSGGGKTFVACNLAAHAVRLGEAVTFHSLEMDWDELTARHLAIISGQPAWKLSPGEHFCGNTFDNAAERLDEQLGTLQINVEPMARLSDVVDGIARAYEETGSRLHIVDFAQLVQVPDATSRYDQVTRVSRAIRATAKRLRVVTVLLSQLGRDGIKAGKPTKEAMDGSGALEQDADQVLLMDYTRKQPAMNPEGKVRGWVGYAILDKNRHGEEPEIPLRFYSDTFRIEERMPDEENDRNARPVPARRLEAVR